MKPSWNFLSFSTKIERELCPDSLQLRTMLRGWSSTCRGGTASASVHSAISKTDCVPCRLPPIPLPATRPTPWTTMTWTWRSWSRFLVYFHFFSVRLWKALYHQRHSDPHKHICDTLYTDFKFCVDRCIWFSPRKLCCFSVTMWIEPDTELQGTPGCLHHRWVASFHGESAEADSTHFCFVTVLIEY